MRVAIDAGTWFNGRGFGRFTRELLGELLLLPSDFEYVVLFDRPAPENFPAQTVQVVQQRLVTDAATADSSRSIGDMWRFSRAVHRTGASVVFYPAIYSWFPAPRGVASLVTIHDAIAEQFPALVLPARMNRIKWNLKVRLATLQATRFLTVSNAAKADIVRFLHLPPGKIDVATEGANRGFSAPTSPDHREFARHSVTTRLKLAADCRYFCYVGGFAAHKNVTQVIRSFAAMRDPTHWLLLVGDPDSHGFQSSILDIQSEIAASGPARSRIVFTGFVEDALLACVYAGADALIMPSLSEGFGLPAVEAMYCGTPVLGSTAGALPEVVGDAGVLFDAADTQGFAAAMQRVASDATWLHSLRTRTAKQAAKFTWRRAAELTLQSLQRTAELSGHRRRI